VELDKDRLAKLLNLTESEHDGEALSAIRKANELLRQCKTNWPATLGLSQPENEPIRPEPSPERPIHTPPPHARRTAEMPLGYLRAKAYRNAFRREPVLPRLLGFPFWIVVELMALAMPNRILDTRGTLLTTVFTLSMMLGILAWIGLGYYLLVDFDFD
jgi:hypothetical protein